MPRSDVITIARFVPKDFVGNYKRQDEPFAVSSVIARVAVLGFVDFLGFAFKIRARQIVEQHIKTGAKEIFPALSQMLFQASLCSTIRSSAR